MPCYVERTGFTGVPRSAPAATPSPARRQATAPVRNIVAAARLSTGLLGVPPRLTRDGATTAERNLAAGWARVAARPLNSGFAGKRFPLEQRNTELARKYPKSVTFDREGFPDFSPYSLATVRLTSLHRSEADREVAGISRSADFAEADRLAGWTEPDRKAAGLTWHHVQDGQTLMLVPSDLHQAVSHHGGVAHAERVAGPQALVINFVLDAMRDI